MLSPGSSSFRKTPSVALMMPAPTRTTSGSLLPRFSIIVFPDRRLDCQELPAYVSSGYEADIRIGEDATHKHLLRFEQQATDQDSAARPQCELAALSRLGRR